jgi:Tat protein translocase TatB subunit
MFEVGFSEIVLIMGLALLVLGPERLPDLAAKIGRWTGRARAMARQFQAQLEQEVTLDSVSRSPRPPSEPAHTEQTASIRPVMTEPTADDAVSTEEPTIEPAASAQPGSDQSRQ